MAKLPETGRYEADIYQIEKTDPVVGGRDGLSNRQATQLGNRTAWLKQKVDQLSGRWSSVLSGLNAHKADTTAHPPRATNAQALAGQDNAAIMTSLRVKEVMDAQAGYSPTAVVHADNVSVGRVNDYRSGQSATADILQLARSSDFDLTGIVGGTEGKELRVQCTGGGDVTLVHNSTHSAAGNRMWLSPSAYPAGEVKLQQGDTATLLYMRYNASVGAVWVLTGVTQAGVLGVPVGTILPFAGGTLPNGYLFCDGGLLSRVSYAGLFGAIGTIYGAGNGSTTFARPDLRGEFLRGADSGRGVDSARALGSAQGDLFRTHSHGVQGAHGGWYGLTNRRGGFAGCQRAENFYSHTSARGRPFIESQGGTETRPRNVAVNFVIKY